MTPSAAPTAVSTDRYRVKEAAARGRVSTAMIYVWLAEEKFKSWVVRRRGFERGLRFIDAKSFEDFLQSQRENS